MVVRHKCGSDFVAIQCAARTILAHAHTEAFDASRAPFWTQEEWLLFAAITTRASRMLFTFATAVRVLAQCSAWITMGIWCSINDTRTTGSQWITNKSFGTFLTTASGVAAITVAHRITVWTQVTGSGKEISTIGQWAWTWLENSAQWIVLSDLNWFNWVVWLTLHAIFRYGSP